MMALARAVACVATLALLASAPVADAFKLEYTFKDNFNNGPDGSWQFLGKFCFTNNDVDITNGVDVAEAIGKIAWSIKPIGEPENGAHGALSDVRLLLYDDEESAKSYWNDVWDSSASCQDKIQLSKRGDGDYGPYGVEDALSATLPDGTNRLAGKDGWQGAKKIKEHARPRFWYVVISRCGNPKKNPLFDKASNRRLSVTLHFQNVIWSDWNHEFGENERGLNSLYLTFSGLWTLWLLVHIFGVFQYRKSGESVHPIIKLFTVSAAIQYIVYIMRASHYFVFAHDGQGHPELLTTAAVFFIFSAGSFVLLLLLLGKGWTITSDELGGGPVILSGVVFTMVVEGVLLFWQTRVVKPETNLWVYDSAPGWVSIGTTFVVCAWFATTAAISYRTSDDKAKKKLFAQLGVVYSLWLVILPVFVIVAGAVPLSPWVRQITVECVFTIMTTLAYFFMSYLMWPTRADRYFSIPTPTSGMSTYDVL